MHCITSGRYSEELACHWSWVLAHSTRFELKILQLRLFWLVILEVGHSIAEGGVFYSLLWNFSKSSAVSDVGLWCTLS
jgi:hypothetical protein